MDLSPLWRLLPGRGLGVAELARRLDLPAAELTALRPAYRRFEVAKRSGHGRRTLLAPEPALKHVQRRILRRLLALLVSHPAARGFERRASIVENAAAHVGRAVVVRMDIRDFFDSTRAARVERFFRRAGWNRPAAALLRRLTTWEGHLPQGAPTSPRLSNLLNYRLDARLHRLCERFVARYTRYADDLTFSFAEEPAGGGLHRFMALVRTIVADEGYRLHGRRKTHVRRRHHQQRVTGLVVNQRVNLDRRTRRWLRAVEHRARTGGRPTLDAAQRQGWMSFRRMVQERAARA
jgi:retron-type reverse transcriptase